MRYPQLVLLFLCVLGLTSAITGISSYSNTGRGAVVTYHDGRGRVYALIVSVGFAAAAALVRRRRPFVWRLGCVFFAVALAAFFYLSLSEGVRLPRPDAGYASVAVVVVGAVVGGYWALWWWRQREYYFANYDSKA